MKPSFAPLLLGSLFVATSCNTAPEANNTKSVAHGAMASTKDAAAKAAADLKANGSLDLNQLLGSIKDKSSAEVAKGPLESALASLQGMMGTTTGTTGAPTAANASSGMAKMATDALAKFGVNGDTMSMVTGLLSNPSITAVIGPVLQQLKSLLPMQ